jgi:hypothetical protein
MISWSPASAFASVADGENRGAHAAALEVTQQRRPTLRALAVAVLDGDQLLRSVGPNPDHHERTESVLLQPDAEVDPIGPDVDVVAVGEVALLERLVVRLPSSSEAGDRGRREARCFLAEQRSQALLEVSRREATQVEDREHLGDLGRAAHVGRQDLAAEAVADATFGLSAVVYPRSPHFDRP